MILKLLKKSDKETKIWIYLDDELWGTLPARVLQRFLPLPFEEQVSEEEAEEIKSALIDSAKNRLLDYLAEFERSTRQCRNLLKRHHYHDSIIHPLIAEATSLGYLDDSRFAEILVRSLAERNKSRNYIVGKLFLQGITASIYEPYLEEYICKTDVRTYLAAEISKLKVRYRELPPAKQREKIIASLYRKGFDLDDIISNLRD